MARTCNSEELRELVESRSLVVRKNKRSYILVCPESSCQKPKLFIEKKSGRCVCFHCGDGSKAWADAVLARVLNVPRQDLAELLYGDKVAAGTDAILEIGLTDWWSELQSDEEEILIEEELPEVLWGPNYKPLTLGSKGEQYLTGRGIPFELALAYGIRYSGFDRRVAFPVVMDGKMVGYQARAIFKTEFTDEATGQRIVIPKMTTMGEIGGKALMFLDRVKSDHAILAEGPFDALKCHLCGGNTAAMGKGFTRRQLEILARRGVKKLYDALDPDAAEDTMRLLAESKDFEFEVYKMQPPRGAEDMGDLDFGAALEVYRSAPRVRQGQLFVYFNRPV